MNEHDNNDFYKLSFGIPSILAEDKALIDYNYWNLKANAKGHLVFDDCDLVDVAKKYGTPLHVVSRNKLVADCKRFVTAFKQQYDEVEVFYSYKTNNVPSILQVLHRQGLGTEVISGFELWLALKLKVHPLKIVFNGPNKQNDELRLAIKKSIRTINVDNLTEIDRIKKIAEELGCEVNVGLRIMPDVKPSDLSLFVATGSRKAQFGLDPLSGHIVKALKLMKNSRYLRFRGFHTHIGTNVLDPYSYAKAIEKLLSVARLAKDQFDFETEFVDLGGGFPVPMTKEYSEEEYLRYMIEGEASPHDPKLCPPIEEFASTIGKTLKEKADAFGLKKPTLFLEPGRYIASSAQILLLTVGVLKEVKDVGIWAITDGGAANITAPLTSEYHEVLVANKGNQSPSIRYSLVGRICYTGDTIYKNKLLPRLEEGDVICIMDAGAYFTTCSSNFSYGRPAVAMLDRGKSWVIRGAETYQDLILKDKF